MLPAFALSWYGNEEGASAPSFPAATILAVGVTCRAGGALTVSVATRVVFPWPFVVLLKLMLLTYVLGARLFAFEFTVNVTVVPEEVAVPEVEEGVSQGGTLDIE
jgi:hypothetical protein